MTVVTNTTLSLGGMLSGSGGTVSKAGAGTLTFAGAGANTYSGAIDVIDGTLALNKSAGNAIAGSLFIGDGLGTDRVLLLSSNQISDSAWRKIATGLSGDQYQIGMPPELSALTSPLPGLKTYHIESGNQNFYSLPLNANLPDDQISQRLALIDQLLASTSSPAAVEALQNARALLGKKPNN